MCVYVHALRCVCVRAFCVGTHDMPFLLFQVAVWEKGYFTDWTGQTDEESDIREGLFFFPPSDQLHPLTIIHQTKPA